MVLARPLLAKAEQSRDVLSSNNRPQWCAHQRRGHRSNDVLAGMLPPLHTSILRVSTRSSISKAVKKQPQSTTDVSQAFVSHRLTFSGAPVGPTGLAASQPLLQGPVSRAFIPPASANKPNAVYSYDGYPSIPGIGITLRSRHSIAHIVELSSPNTQTFQSTAPPDRVTGLR